MLVRRKYRRPVDRRGAATVEMAFAVPVLLLLLFGIAEISHAFMVQHVIQDAARQGCRLAVLPGATNSAVTTSVGNLLQGEGITKATATILVNGAAGDVTTAQTNDNITVQVAMNATDATIVPGTSYFTGRQFIGSCTLRCE